MGIGQLDIARCGPCCDPCEVANDGSAKTELAGDWSAGSGGGVQTDDSDAAILFDASVTSTTPWLARVSIDVTYTAGATWQVYLAGGAESGTTSTAKKLTYGQDADSLFVQLDSTINDSGGSPPVSGGTHTVHMEICYDGLTLTANVSGDINARLALHDPTFAGGLAGFGTGTLSNITSVRFYDFFFGYSYSESAEDCDECLDHCCKGPNPANHLLDISDFPTSWTLPVSPSGTVLEFDFNGSWSLANIGDDEGSATCQWESEDYEGTVTTPGFPPTVTNHTVWIVARTARNALNDNIRLDVTAWCAYGSGGQVVVWSAYRITADACVTWTDWVELTKSFSDPYATILAMV